MRLETEAGVLGRSWCREGIDSTHVFNGRGMCESLSPGQGVCSARRPALRLFLNESAFLLCEFQGAPVCCWTMGTGSVPGVPGGRVLMSRREVTGTVACAYMRMRRQGCSIPGPRLYLQSPPQVARCSILFHRKPGFGGLLCHL